MGWVAGVLVVRSRKERRPSPGPPRGTEPFRHPRRLDLTSGGRDRLDLVRRAQRGDHDAFDELVDRHAPKLYRLAVAVIGPALAPDATQDALVRAWRELPGLREPAAFEAWLDRILVNRCRDLARADRRRVRLITVDELDGAHPSSADPAARVDRSIDLDRALARLSVDQRAVLALVYFAGLPIREAAGVLGIPDGTARSRLHAGLEALRKELR
jgi:RNA polymerase sigma-70 factor (ECF subfamily)